MPATTIRRKKTAAPPIQMGGICASLSLTLPELTEVVVAVAVAVGCAPPSEGVGVLVGVPSIPGRGGGVSGTAVDAAGAEAGESAVG